MKRACVDSSHYRRRFSASTIAFALLSLGVAWILPINSRGWKTQRYSYMVNQAAN
jgi:hypothetical protein